jgi:hypothetical protein
MQTEPENQEWYSYDLGCTASLVSLGFRLLAVERETDRKSKFIFEDSTELRQASEAYFNDELEINPRTLMDSVRLLKNRLHSVN